MKSPREKINAEVEITRIGFGTYATQLNLALSAQEDLDLFNAMTSNVVTLANSGQIMPLTELLNTCGQETLAAIPEADWKAMSVGDEIYALPTNCDKGYQLGFNMRKDIVDELGISIEDIKDFDDLHDMLVKVKAAYPDMYPVVPDGQSMWNYQYYDTLGEQYGASFGVLDLSVDPQLYHSWSICMKQICTVNGQNGFTSGLRRALLCRMLLQILNQEQVLFIQARPLAALLR